MNRAVVLSLAFVLLALLLAPVLDKETAKTLPSHSTIYPASAHKVRHLDPCAAPPCTDVPLACFAHGGAPAAQQCFKD